MALLEVNQLGFGFAGDVLFRDVTFRVERGERAALVAPNGAGKSTLLRLLMGELVPDQGSVVFEKGIRVGYYRQSDAPGGSGSLLDVLLGGFEALVTLRHQLHDAQERAASGTPEALERLSVLMERYQHAGGDELEHRVERIAHQLGFPRETLERPVESLSGGERGRVALGSVLATEPDLLLLDEPTNHLDLETIDWLAQFLTRATRTAVLVVSHDRAFLDAACPSTMELGSRSFRVYPLAYTAYHEARQGDLERERAQVEQQSDLVAKTEDFIRRNIAGQKTKQAQARRKMLDKLERVEGPEDIWERAGRVRFRFADCPRSGDLALQAEGLAASRGDRTLFRNVDLLVRRGERVGIVGPNGCGKTTLMRRLAGLAPEPGDAGTVRLGAATRHGYFDQHLGGLRSERSCIQEIQSVRGDFNDDVTRQYLSRFRFYGDASFRSVASLSGGERTRLALGKLLLEPRNLLFLDEPTNHLDIPAAEILEEALVDFEGTVVLVSHDRRFLENVTTRVVAFEPAGVRIYETAFRDFDRARAARAAEEELSRTRSKSERPPRGAPPAQRQPAAKAAKPAPASPVDDKAARQAEHEARRRAGRDVERMKKRLGELETGIQRAETRLGELRARLRTTDGKDWEALVAVAEEERTLTKQAEAMLEEWSTLGERLAALDGA